MPFYSQWERTLDAKGRLALPARIQEGLGPSVFLAAINKGGLRILPKFKPPKGKERMFFQVAVKYDGTSPRILIGEDARRQFQIKGLRPGRKVLLVGCGDHLELYPVGSK